MSARRIASVLLPAVLLGLVGWYFANNSEPGINRTLWLVLAVLLWIVIRMRNGAYLMRDEKLLLGAITALSLALLWRDDDMLTALNTMAIAVSFGLLPLAARAERSRIGDLGVFELIEAGVRFGFSLLAGLIPEVIEAHRAREQKRGPSVLGPVVRGAIFCGILLPIFGGLLAQADRDFAAFLNGIFTLHDIDLMQELLLILFFSWLGAGLLAGTMVHRERVDLDQRISMGQLGTIEISMVLGGLNLLFAAFIGFQVQRFFGGASWVAAEQGVTLSSYAREGFFQLVVVAALAVPVLLFFESRVREAGEGPVKVYRALAFLMVGLVFAIMASAMQRMVLYQREFGLTVDRFFASAFMAGLAVTLAWLVVTVLRGASHRFAGGFLVAWAAWLGVLNLSNPERIIVEANLARVEQGKALDVSHLMQLQSDAVPAIIEGLDRLAPEVRLEVLERLRKRDFTGEDWGAWHPSRARAERLVRDAT